MGRRQYTTSLTAPVLVLALAGCDKARQHTPEPTEIPETDALNESALSFISDFFRDVLAFDEPKDYAIAVGVGAGVIGLGAAAGGGGDSDSATSTGGGASNPTPNPNPTPANQAPAFATDNATATASENATAVAYTLNATDPDNGDTLTYSLKPNTGDVALFSITSAGVLSFKTAPDYEFPPSSKTSYSVTVIASDGNSATANAEQTVAITLNNVNEAPTIAAGTTASATVRSVAENNTTWANTVFYTAATAADVDSGDTLTYSVVDEDGGTDGDSTYFTIDSSRQVTFAASPNYEAKSTATYSFKVRVSDTGGLTATTTETVTVMVTNVNEGKAAFSVTGSTTGAPLMAVKTADDPDGNGTFTYQWQKTTDTLSGEETLADLTGWGSASSTASYTPASADTYVRLQQVTYADGAGSSETVTLTDNVFQVYVGTSGNDGDSISNILGGSGRNYMNGGAGDDYLRGNNGADILYGGAGNDTLWGWAGDDILHGGAGDDQLIGFGDDDILYGGAGSDELIGQAGADIMTGGAGSDDFTLELGKTTATDRAKDVVTDFTSGDQVRVDAKSGKTYTNLTEANALEGLATSGQTLSWVTNNTTNTRDTTAGNASTADTVFFIDLDNDDTLDSGETIVLILEDYSTTLTSSDFDLF